MFVNLGVDEIHAEYESHPFYGMDVTGYFAKGWAMMHNGKMVYFDWELPDDSYYNIEDAKVYIRRVLGVDDNV